jgi:hypothetical protein
MNAVSSIIGGLILIIIIISSISLIYFIINSNNNLQNKFLNEIGKIIQYPILSELEINGQTYLVSTKPTIIKYLIFPNGSALPVNINLNKIPVNLLLHNQPWVVVVTQEGIWINVTNINSYSQLDNIYSIYLKKLLIPIPADPNLLYYNQQNQQYYFNYIISSKSPTYPIITTPLGINNVTIPIPFQNLSLVISSLGIPRADAQPSWAFSPRYSFLIVFPVGSFNIIPTKPNQWQLISNNFLTVSGYVFFFNPYYNITYIPALVFIYDHEEPYSYSPPAKKGLEILFLMSTYFDPKCSCIYYDPWQIGNSELSYYHGYLIKAFFPQIDPYSSWKFKVEIFQNQSGNFVRIFAYQNGTWYQGNLYAPIGWSKAFGYEYPIYGYSKVSKFWWFGKLAQNQNFYVSIPVQIWNPPFEWTRSQRGPLTYPIYLESIQIQNMEYIFYN